MTRQRDGSGMTSQRTRDRLVRRLEVEGIRESRTLEAMRHVPRHLFVDEALASRAYEDMALPIGHGQTISQPFVVARMTEVLVAGREVSKVLEIGTGCGYQSAVLARIVGTVFTIERIRDLVWRARQRLASLGVHNVRLRHGDGYAGWPGEAPFDGIIVTAAPTHIPSALVEQLAPGGRLVAPVGGAGDQALVLLTRGPDGIEEHILERVSFVPMLEGTDTG
ncbi:MAG: protein-L-isoaspartate(D-aspartate) O-methyltransferase [Ectothiorhodospiraceae bacterium]|nr:protein-L-isoaspartate(D-aspartate) O-methyltransferase [Chromatiales bacterium]MCP5157385.1 protein-L-isoaspartate(D-aspartate) O-methyltransferase [Ectothiorhodospiraceae bacterium]